MNTTKLRLGVSKCLLGEAVRYDGQHKLDRYIRDTLGAFVEFVPVCPEVECGLSIPREAMRLVGDPEAPRLITQRSKRDLTDMMLSWAIKRVRELDSEQLCGFIFKAKSPSSGMERVKVYNDSGGIAGSSPGLFAKAFMQHNPLLPVEEEGRLHDVDLRENFIERIFCLKRWRDEALTPQPTAASLMQFHARHKLLLMSHSPTAVSALGRCLATMDKQHVTQAARGYEQELLKALRLRATPRKHVNVMQHMLGYFKKLLSHDEKAELLDVIQRYRDGFLPLIVPITLLQHYVRNYQIDYLTEQVYLHPHPLELKLRNHA